MIAACRIEIGTMRSRAAEAAREACRTISRQAKSQERRGLMALSGAEINGNRT